MMSGRNVRESLLGSLNHHRRGHSFNGVANNNHHHDDNLDLFSDNRRSLALAASSDDSSDVSVKLGRLSVGTAKPVRSGIDDLLSSTEGGKHDYDWLLTPPGTPVFPSEGETQTTLAPPRRSLTRSTSTSKASRLAVSQSENNPPSRPARSSSVTRSSISTSHSQYSSYSSNRHSSSILNTSSASVSSYIRPSSPVTHSSSAARPSTPSSRPTASRSSTPSKPRSVSTNSTAEKNRPSSQGSRPSTPSSRPHIPANLHSPSASSTRSLSRPSTPTRRSSMPSLSPSPSPTTGSLTSAGRVSSNGRSSAPASRPSSPSPRVRPPPQPIVPPDFPLETPPNLRTTLPDRPVSAGRSRPGGVTMKANVSETQASPVTMPRRHSSPIVSRGRVTEPAAKTRGYSNGHHADASEPRKVSHAPEVAARKSIRSSTTAPDNTGFGRTISKKSLDMAIKHMDIRNSSGNIRSLSSTTLFPQSIRTSTSKSHRVSSAPASVDMNGSMISSKNGANFDVGNGIDRNMMMKGRDADERQYSAKLSEVDIYESSRYDALLFKEDLKNTNWLHGADDKCDQGPIFDNGFEHLPEPFGLL
ncbi:flocculation protein FLO11-like [Glycine soja]|uniref:Uncharacterized protein n=1 Tax=Glycine soja TaxID=3848 RepID=A0A445FVZ8_GLYSO|nr:flocculation protein FLO11-like [Glycine soja]RZB53090.1 hypothetical protein D0Y65_049222 [Glycine soja]